MPLRGAVLLLLLLLGETREQLVLTGVLLLLSSTLNSARLSHHYDLCLPIACALSIVLSPSLSLVLLFIYLRCVFYTARRAHDVKFRVYNLSQRYALYV